MTALAADTNVTQYGTFPLLADLIPLDVAASTKIYAGSMVAIDGSGNAKPISAAAGLRVLGRCEDSTTVDNSSGSAGAKTCNVRRGVFLLSNSATTDALTKADIGRKVFAADDNTVSRTSNFGKRPIMGVFLGLLTVGGVSKCIVQVGVMEDDDPTEIRVLAGADLSASQYFFVKFDTNTAAVLAGAGENAVGILQNAPASGAVAIIKTYGMSHMIAVGAITKGAAIAADTTGKGKTAVASTTKTDDAGAASDPLVGSHVMGFALETGSANADIMVFLQPKGAIPTTAA